MFVVYCFGVLLLQAHCAGSQKVTIEVEPATFLPAVTPSASIHCSVTAGNSSSSLRVLVMQILKRGPSTRSRRDAGEKKEKTIESVAETDPEVLLVTATPGESAVTLNVDSQNGRLTADGSITATDGSPPLVSLRIGSPMVEQDAGGFVCEVSVLDNKFHVETLRAEATLSIIDQEGSAVLLLAKEQMLEEEEKELEKQEKLMKADVLKTQQQQAELAHSVEEVKTLTQTLSSRLDAMDEAMKTLTTKLNGAELEATLRAPAMTVSKDEVDVLKKQLSHLESNLLPSLLIRVDALENKDLSDIKTRLKTLEDGMSAAVIGKAESQSDHSGSDSGLTKLEVRLDAVTRDILDPLRKRLDRLEQDNLGKLNTRVMTVEEELPKVREDVGDLRKGLANLTDTLHQLQDEDTRDDRDTNTDSKDQDSKSSRKCYVCGDVDTDKPCTLDDLRANTLRSCTRGVQFCMNDIIQKGTMREIFKRCVDESTCRTNHNARTASCADFSFMSTGEFQCHYCCTEDACNEDFKPQKSLLE